MDYGDRITRRSLAAGASAGWLLRLLSVIAFWAVASAGFAREPGSPVAHLDYEADVPVELRGLVTAEAYRAAAEHLAARSMLPPAAIRQIAASPCGGSLTYLVDRYTSDPLLPDVFDAIVAGLRTPPVAYGMDNPWRAAGDGRGLLVQMVDYFARWCTFLPQISGSHDTGLAYIRGFAWTYYRNPAAQAFVQGRNPFDETQALEVGLRFTREFTRQRGAFMDTRASTLHVQQWIDDPRIEIQDYEFRKASDYPSWNRFFARNLARDADGRYPSRPVTMPDRDYVVVSPTDCIMNPLTQVLEAQAEPVRTYVTNPLQYDTVLDIKGIPISLHRLLGNAPEEIKQAFVGGTGQSCILMPNTYHHFHAPVDGVVVHAEVVPDNTYGYPDWPNWVPTDGIVGRPGTDFSQFEAFQRGVIVIQVTYDGLNGEALTGYVASVPVGLDTIGSVVLAEGVAQGASVVKGVTPLGNFFYGGSLDILLYSKGLAGAAVQTRMGNQINVLNVGEAPAVDPPPPPPVIFNGNP